MIKIAKIQSTESSNKIEGIYTSDDRLKKIVLDKTMPNTRNEREIAGYRGEADSLLIITMFIIDFLCIHPFNDGNGRMSRLLTLLLPYQNDYIVGKYISLEKLIERTKDNYYDVLQESSQGWMEGENNYEPFVKYIFGIITAAYREFFDRAKIVEEKKVLKSVRIEEIIRIISGNPRFFKCRDESVTPCHM